MQLHHSQVTDTLIVKPMEKRIDASNATEFKQAMNDWIDAGHRKFVINLEVVDFIDSSGLGAIISSLRKIGSGGDLVICGVKETVMSLFRLTRMNRVFDILPSEQEALGSLSK
ncbi:MAG: STAS domain-containing protein [Thermoleophilia bacterium]|jgi:anti-sigma B factor antagonist